MKRYSAQKKMHSSGYTFIELLVVVTIGIIVFGVGIASYREFSRRQDLTGITKRMITDLRSIQQLSLSGQKPEGFVCSKLDGYTFSRVSSTDYNLIANCDNAGTPVNINIKSVTLDSDVTFTATTAVTTFKVLGQGTNLVADNVLTLSNSASGNTNTITIGVGGNIR